MNWFKRKLRPAMIAWARRRIGSTRRGPVQGVQDIGSWLASHPGEGRWLVRHPGWSSPLAPSLHQEGKFIFPGQAAGFSENAGDFVAEIRGAYVTGPSVGIITPDRRLLPEVSVEFGHPPQWHGAMRKVLFPKPTRLAGRWGLLAVTGGNSYYHHMTEVLPRVEMMRRAGLREADLAGWIVNGSSHPYQKESWERLGFPAGTLRFVGDGSYYQCESLVIPSLPTNPGRITPWIPPFLQTLFGAHPKHGTRRLYFRRPKAGSRGVEDEREVLKLLASFFFEAVDAETMTVQEQGRICAEAQAIVGPHGGAMTNAVFASPGALLVEFFNPRYLNPCYWQLAGVCGLRHAHVLGEPDEDGQPAPAGDASGNIRLGTDGLEKVRRILSAELGRT